METNEMTEYIQTGLDYLNMVPGPAWAVIGGVALVGYRYIRNYRNKGQTDQRSSLFNTIHTLLPQTAMWATEGDTAVVSAPAGVRICFKEECPCIRYGDKDITKTLYDWHARKLVKKARRLHAQIVETKAQMDAANVNLSIQQKATVVSLPGTPAPKA
jgi:hypothetical protein